LASPAGAQPPPDLAPVGWQQRLGAALPLQLSFTDEEGRVAPLSHYFGERPVALVLMYLSCSQLCPLTLSQMQRAFDRAGLVPGRDFELLAISIDPWDRPAAAAARKAQLAHSGTWQRGLHILTAAWPPTTGRATAPPDSAAQLAAAAGFGYVYDPRSRQYGHPAGWLLINPRGRISRYFFGVQYDAAAVRAAVRAAAAGAPPTWSQPLRLLCYCLTVLTGRYDGAILDILRALCLALFGAGGWWLWRMVHAPPRST
jgi:protein SCO1/2